MSSGASGRGDEYVRAKVAEVAWVAVGNVHNSARTKLEDE